MRLSKLFSQSLRNPPTECDTKGYQYLVRAGYIRLMASGIFSFLPLGRRSIRKIETIMREEMDAIGGQEVSMPVVQPADLWKQTNRWSTVGPELTRLKDRTDRDMVLALTHEETTAFLAASEIHSYRQLPSLIYHIQTKWRDDARPRAGLIRVREFTMLDSYSLDRDLVGLEKQYQTHMGAYRRIFKRCGLPVREVQSDTGVMGGQTAKEYMYLSPAGEDTLVICDSCGYSSNLQVASSARNTPDQERLQTMEKVATPECKTIQSLADYLHIPTKQTAKAVFLTAEWSDQSQLVFAVVRGDMDVNENKVLRLLKARSLRPATDVEIRTIPVEPGYASPVGLPHSSTVMIIADDWIQKSTNLAAGANETGFHLLNVNYGRDFTADLVADITTVREGDACINCGNRVRLEKGIEVGNIFQLGTHYTDALDAHYLDEEGREKSIWMGSYGIGVGRLLGSLAEHYHDERGLCLPLTVAPYTVHFVSLPGKNPDLNAQAEVLYTQLRGCGIEVLFDDRSDSPGVKFGDADLIGCPVRITISERSLGNGGVEIKPRTTKESHVVPMDEVSSELNRILNELAQPFAPDTNL